MARKRANTGTVVQPQGGTPPTAVVETSTAVPVAPPLGDPLRAMQPRVQAIRTAADLTREYVAAGGWGWVTEYARTLPQYIDERTRDFGLDLYARRMRLDAQVESALSTLLMATQAQGFTMRPNKAKNEDGYAASQAIHDFCHKNLDHLDRPVTDYLFEAGAGVAQGFKVMEQIYAVEDWGAGPQLVLKALHGKPQTSTAFVVDAYNNTLGLVYTRPGAPIPALTVLPGANVLNGAVQGTITDPIIVPRIKFWIFTWMPENGDPRGRSILAPAYHPWWVKNQIWKSYLAYLATFGQPSIVGFVSATATSPYLLDANGNPLDAITPKQLMANALEKIQNGAVGAFDNDEKIQVLQATGNGAAFIEALNIANREITKAIIRQTLTTDEGAHMARAASEIHQDVFGLLVRYTKRTLVGSFTRDVVRPLVLYNFGADAARELLPICSLGETEHQDFASDATAISALVRAGYFDESQYPELDEFLDLPLRDPTSWAAKVARAEALVEAAVAVGPPGAQAGGAGDATAASSSPSPAAAGKSAVADDTQKLAARLVAKASAMRIADRMGTVGPA